MHCTHWQASLQVGWLVGDSGKHWSCNEKSPGGRIPPPSIPISIAGACKLGIQFSHLQGETLGSVFSRLGFEAAEHEDLFWGRCRNFWLIYGTRELGIWIPQSSLSFLTLSSVIRNNQLILLYSGWQKCSKIKYTVTQNSASFKHLMWYFVHFCLIIPCTASALL